MPANSLTAKANVGAGVDALAGVSTAQGFAGAAMLVHANGTDVEAANPLPAFTPDAASSGSIAMLSQSFEVALNGRSAWSCQVEGTWTGTLQFEGTSNDTNWRPILGALAGIGTTDSVTTANSIYRGNCAALSKVRVIATTAITGTALVTIRVGNGTGAVFMNGPMLALRRDSDTAPVADGKPSPLTMDEEGRVKVSNKPASYASTSGSIIANGGTLAVNVSRVSNVMVHLASATALVGHNATFEGSLNSTNGTDGAWFVVQAVRSNANTVELTTGTQTGALTYAWELSVNGLNWFRVRATAHTSGTAGYVIQPGAYATEPIPAQQVTATQPVSGTVTATGVAGAAAHSAAASGNPVQVGGVVATAVSTAEVVGDACRLQMTTGGALTVKPYAVPETDWTYAAAAGGIVNTTDVAIKAAAGAGIRNYLTGISIVNASATVATEVVVKDGATIIGRWYVGIGSLLNSAIGLTFPTPLRSTANTALSVACVTTGAQVYVNAQGYAAP